MGRDGTDGPTGHDGSAEHDDSARHDDSAEHDDSTRHDDSAEHDGSAGGEESPGHDGPSLPEAGPEAAYVFRVAFRLEPDASGVWTDPRTFEATVYRQVDRPGEEGWLYFRDNLWKGELADPEWFREIAGETLGVRVERVSFRELQASRSHLDDLRAEIADDLETFDASTVDEVLSRYLGSSIHVVDS